MKFTKYISLGLIVLSSSIFANLNSHEREVEAVNKIMDLEQGFKDQWLSYKKHFHDKAIDLMIKQNRETLNHKKHALKELALKKISVNELCLEHLKLLEEHGKECHKLYTKLMEEARKIHQRQMHKLKTFKEKFQEKNEMRSCHLKPMENKIVRLEEEEDEEA